MPVRTVGMRESRGRGSRSEEGGRALMMSLLACLERAKREGRGEAGRCWEKPIR